MPDPPEPAAPDPVPPSGPAPGSAEEEDAGDFITRNVLEKDSVFFEG